MFRELNQHLRLNPKVLELVGISLIVGLAFWLRLYRLTTPLADWHSWRQADTASVTREYVKNGVDLLMPQYHDLSNIPSGLDNPNGYRMVEFPIINGLTARLYQFFPRFDLHVFSRLISIFFSLGTLIFLYLLVLEFSGKKEALLTALVFVVLPYSVYYSRTILPEVAMVFFSLVSIYFLVRWLALSQHSIRSFHYWLSAMAAALALLLKPYAIFLALPMAYLAWKRCGGRVFKSLTTYLYPVLALTPLLLWRIWISQFPEGIPAFGWLFNGDGIRFKGAFFRWIFAERIGKLILGYWGLIFLGLGLIKPIMKKEGWFFIWWMVAVLVYVTVFATGNVRHDYYQIPLIPIISIFVAKGIFYLIERKNVISYSLLITSLLFMLAFSWFEVRGYYNINNWAIVEAGKAIDRLTPADALVIAPYNGDAAFLYQTNRRGWPIGGEIEDKISKGADYYVSVSFDEESQSLMDAYPVVDRTETYVVVRLMR
ncbi:hypothetical protein A2783_01210 [Microgenomates group bacterium RIFCSPHIGHO2_01_FULL_45_11]|nr:MAG: hypothetical protein A2783_01210 [Microgenomates group bacterium RIFCSPHIGHO2_01_FULL_45_11]